jgi:RNA methyltransferase, TrmH family
MMLSSLSNPRVKRVRRLQNDKRFRSREAAFVIEGTRLLDEAAHFPERIAAVYYTRDWYGKPEHRQILQDAEQAGVEVNAELMAAMSSTETAPGVIAELDAIDMPLPEAPSLVLILDALSNPGNLGSIFRSAGASAVDVVLLAPGCVDAYNPKVVRGGMGAHFRLPIRQLTWPEISNYTRDLAIRLATAGAELSYADIDWRVPSALIIGNEAVGPGKSARQIADSTISIPMAGATESLNAAMATSVILFEAFRQRGFEDKRSNG